MKYSDFESRFNLAVNDFVHKRPIKDDGAAYAAASVSGLRMGQVLPPKVIVHQIMLAGVFPYLRQDAALAAYQLSVPWLTRIWASVQEWHAGLANPPDQLPKLRSRD